MGCGEGSEGQVETIYDADFRLQCLADLGEVDSDDESMLMGQKQEKPKAGNARLKRAQPLQVSDDELSIFEFPNTNRTLQYESDDEPIGALESNAMDQKPEERPMETQPDGQGGISSKMETPPKQKRLRTKTPPAELTRPMVSVAFDLTLSLDHFPDDCKKGKGQGKRAAEAAELSSETSFQCQTVGEARQKA